MKRYVWNTILASLFLLLASVFVFARADEEPLVDSRTLDLQDPKPTKTESKEPPAVVDLRRFQTSIKNQGGRDSCPYFPPVAALEAAYKRKGIDVGLSVEHLIWLRNVTAGSNKDSSNLAENLFSMVGGGNGMGVLTHYAISRSQDMPYHGQEPGPAKQVFGVDKYDWSKPFDQFVLNRWNLDPGILPPSARANARYAIDRFESFRPNEVKDPKKFEEILAGGHEIVFAINLHSDSDDAASGQPVWRLKPGAKPGSINHFMLMVGYDRKRKFFIVKNQWGPTKYVANKLAAGWKDVVKYNGYTLLDYNYLAQCWEAHYITEVAPVASTRFAAQRALGQWLVAFKHKDKQIMAGVLCWRRLPNLERERKEPDLRIGDLVTTDGRQFRVNAESEGDGKKPFQTTLYIDFNSGTMPGNSTNGTAWKGTVTLPERGEHLMELKCVRGAKELLWGQPAGEIQVTAALVENRNLLLTMKPPK